MNKPEKKIRTQMKLPEPTRKKAAKIGKEIVGKKDMTAGVVEAVTKYNLKKRDK